MDASFHSFFGICHVMCHVKPFLTIAFYKSYVGGNWLWNLQHLCYQIYELSICRIQLVAFRPGSFPLDYRQEFPTSVLPEIKFIMSISLLTWIVTYIKRTWMQYCAEIRNSWCEMFQHKIFACSIQKSTKFYVIEFHQRTKSSTLSFTVSHLEVELLRCIEI